MEEIFVKTKDNTNIGLNYYSGNFENAVIIAPGWCMTKDSSAFKNIAEFFAESFDVMCFDFRGHGKSAGFYTFTAKEPEDMEAVIEFAKSKSYKNIYVAGFSLGAAIALICGAKNEYISKIIAVSAPYDFNKIENHMWRKEAWAETFKKFELGRFLSIRPSIIPYKKIKPCDIVKQISVPTLFIAGENDPTVYPWHTEELFKEACCKKEYKLFSNGCHAEDLFLHFPEEFEKLCSDWLKD